jgi:hypothetical protein
MQTSEARRAITPLILLQRHNRWRVRLARRCGGPESVRPFNSTRHLGRLVHWWTAAASENRMRATSPCRRNAKTPGAIPLREGVSISEWPACGKRELKKRGQGPKEWRVSGPEPCSSTIAGWGPGVAGAMNVPASVVSPLRNSTSSSREGILVANVAAPPLGRTVRPWAAPWPSIWNWTVSSTGDRTAKLVHKIQSLTQALTSSPAPLVIQSAR